MKRKLTPFSRLLIVLLIVAGAFYVIRYVAPQYLNTDPTEVADRAGKEEAKTPAVQPGSFDYVPPTPVEGRLKGVVELGASGFNSFIIEVDAEKRWSLEKAEFGASLVHENMATAQDIREGLKRYIAQMLDYGVDGRDIHFVVSSGANKEPEVEKIRAGLKSLGYVVNTVTVEQEGNYALRSALPEAFEGKAFVVDIGSGNTKVSWMANGRIESFGAYGSKYYQDNIPDGEVYLETRSVAGQIPKRNTEVAFIIGGIPFELARGIRQGEERYTVLKAPDAYEPEGEKQRCGLNIYKAIADATGCETFVFDWHANFTIGFLLQL